MGAGPAVAVGFRAHLGWADAVTLAVAGGGAEVRDRRRLELRPAGGTVFPYHAAQEALPEDREEMIAAGLQAAEASATDALADLLADLGFWGVGVVVSRGLRHIPLEKVLASSRLLHAAEGAIYQRALRNAAANLGVPCSVLGFNEAEGHALWPAVSVLGKQIGPPWRKDQKLAALVAWLAAGAGADPPQGLI